MKSVVQIQRDGSIDREDGSLLTNIWITRCEREFSLKGILNPIEKRSMSA